MRNLSYGLRRTFAAHQNGHHHPAHAGPLRGYVGDQYLDGNLEGGEAKVEGTDIVVPGSFRFKHNWGGVVDPGENRMEILFTPQRYGDIRHGGMYRHRDGD